MKTELALLKQQSNPQTGFVSAPLKKPSLLEFAETGQARFFVQFSGQAGLYMDELRHLYETYPLLRTLIEMTAREIAQQVQHPDALASGLYSWGFDVLSWIKDPKKVPPLSYISSSVISQTLTFLTQICHYKSVVEYGNTQTLLRYTLGLTGHSQGVIPAVLLSLGLDGAEFEKTFLAMIRHFFWQGLRMQQSYVDQELHNSLKEEVAKNEWGIPSPMAALSGVTPKQIESFLKKINAGLEEHEKVAITLQNGWKRFILSGSTKGLVLLRRALQIVAKKTEKDLVQTFNFHWEFLNVSAPFHSAQMQNGYQKYLECDLERVGLRIEAKDLKLPVYATNDGRNLQNSDDLVGDLVKMQFIQPVDWNACTKTATRSHGVTHVLDFGPGDMASKLTFLNREGEGVVVIPCATSRGRDEFLTTDPEKVSFIKEQWSDLAPRVVQVGDKKKLENRYTRFTGNGPVFGGGMTPTSVETDIVAAALNEGYLVEWAGGGQVTEAIMRKRLNELAAKLKPGKWVTLNALYLDAYLWNLQYPLISQFKKEGYPIAGLTISAGIPSRDKAAEIISQMVASDIWCLSFKPGSDAQIKSVLEIADDHAALTLIMQIEGGKAGGHHSWEDLYGLLERNYAAIRRRKNVILCVGGGIGFEEEAYRFISGSWHENGKIMPVDGIILGTRLMAVKEAKTSPQIKKLLADISGTPDWVKRHEFKGGVTSGQSQLGADVHYADNTMARVADKIDQISKLEEKDVFAQKDDIIKLINQTAKPYFGELPQMTYAQVLERMLELMAPGNMPEYFISDGAFFDVTFRKKVFGFAERIVARLGDSDTRIQMKDLDDPKSFLKNFFTAVPQAKEKVLHPEDVDYFMLICREPGKPVNFVPVIDKNIKRWFKGDSLWQAHDPRYLPEQVLTIPGPEAVKGIKKIDEPVADVLGGFENYIIDQILKNESEVSEISFLGSDPERDTSAIEKSVENSIINDGKDVEITVLEKIDDLALWGAYLAKQGRGAISALLECPRVLDGKTLRKNFVPRLLKPEVGSRLHFIRENEQITSISYFCGTSHAPVTIVQLPQTKAKNPEIKLHLYHHSATGKELRMDVGFTYQPENTHAPISLDAQDLQKSLQQFYQKLWISADAVVGKGSCWQTFTGETKISQDSIRDFSAITYDKTTDIVKGEASPSFAIALFWEPLAQCLLHGDLDVNLVNLLHLSNEFEWFDKIEEGKSYQSEVKLVSVTNEPKGKTLQIEGCLFFKGELIVKMKSAFLVRQAVNSDIPVFETHYRKTAEIMITQVLDELLRKKTWFKCEGSFEIGDKLKFALQVDDTKHVALSHYKVTGDIFVQDKKIGSVHFDEDKSLLLQNPVLYFVSQYALNGKPIVKQENGFIFEETIKSPLSNAPYSIVSEDLNPIHTDEKFAILANLPHGTIVHGMWTSAATLSVVARRFKRIHSWQVGFTAMVLSGMTLKVKVQHVSNQDGYKIIEVTSEDQTGRAVLKGTARVAQKNTAYVFTGQGSQVAGMGMVAYQESEAARAIWDRVDKYCQKELGFSIIKVVRDNPKEMLVDGHKVFHPKGVLHLTQFAQVGLTVLALAQMTELKAAGLYQKDAMFAGHSLGEYAGLGCFGILSIEDMVRVVYHRGLTMQHFVPRDAEGRSPFGMVVIRPSAIGWTQTDLEERVEALTRNGKGEAIYVVNYNIEGSQYSITGHLSLLKKLQTEIKEIEVKVSATKSACIWVEGVDVPFHSPLLRGGVEAFRKTLQHTISEFHPEFLVDRYVPNLNAEPFRLDKDYAQSIFNLTESPVLKDVIKNWSEYEKTPGELSRILLIELLAYQFASPVRWIQTQKVFLTHPKYLVDRVIEIGPSPVLSNMMKATAGKVNVVVAPEIHQFDTERDAVFYRYEPVVEEAPTAASVTTTDQKVFAAVVEKSVVSASVGNVPIPQDKSFGPDRGLKALLAVKFKIRLDEIKDSDTLEALSSGNSAKRNELLSDIGAEFEVDALDDAHLMPLSKLAQLLAEKSHYSKVGPLLTKNVDRAIKEFLPLGKNDILDYFTRERRLPVGLAEAALCYLPLAVRAGNSNKAGKLSAVGLEGRISDKSKALAWLETMVDDFGALEGIKIPHASQGGGDTGSMVSEAALGEMQEKFFGKNSPFANWARELSDLCGWQEKSGDALSHEEALKEELAQLKLYKQAFGPQVEKVIRPIFDAGKVVSFTSSWNWGRERLIYRFWQLIGTQQTFSESEVLSLSNQITLEAQKVARYLATVAEDRGNSSLAKTLKQLSETSLTEKPRFVPHFASQSPHVTVSEEGAVVYTEKNRDDAPSFSHFVKDVLKKHQVTHEGVYAEVLDHIARENISFAGKVALVTGAAPGSIAWEVVKAYLAGGATVISTTTSYNENRLKAYRSVYQEFGARGATLHVVPFSQGSFEDINALVSWCFAEDMIPDYVLPFGAVGEVATLTMMNPDSGTATLRVLLQGVEWLIAAIARKHKEVFAKNHSSLVILPLSPNHGVFGGDGAYADSKLGLESLLNKWHGENDDWGRQISLVGATIGWVRGTGLMEANNVIAAAMENEGGVRTFSTAEMGTLLVSLCHDKIAESAKQAPLSVSLTGGFEKIKNIATLARESRENLEKQAALKREIKKALASEQQALRGEQAESRGPVKKAAIESEFPVLGSYEDLLRVRGQKDFDLSQVVVVVGYGEVSPFGSSKPRWDMECGEISQTGAIELAWIMGLIRYDDGLGKSKYQGWVDAKSGKPVADAGVWKEYGKFIQENTGVRFADAKLHHFDPQNTVVFGTVALEGSLTFSVEDQAQALEYMKQYPDSAQIKQEEGAWKVTLLKGSLVKVPRRVSLKRWVAGQIPAGWDATRLGVGKELVDQVDRNTLFNMIASAEAFMRSGLNPTELNNHFMPSMIGNSQGGGMGGMTSLDRMYHDHREDKDRQGDTLQETLINVGPAWVVQSLVGSYGPMVHPVAACATALVSLSVGADLIGQGKSDFVVSGGFDDYSEEGVIGFQDMQATCDTQEMLDKGIAPHAMSRPNDARRGGFVEAQGGGTLLLCRMDKAVELGLPIYAVLGFTGSYSDGVHTSIPAPGLGLLGMARGGLDKSPLGQALKKFGLVADDITVVSKHDTSTAANDPNENKLHQLVQQSLGRTPGNPLYVHSQKAKLGHAKGGAGAWQAIAAVQMLTTGKVPGNQNLEDVDAKMKAFDFMSFSDKTLNLGLKNIHSVLMTSLGFGHVGAATLLIHPDYLLSRLSKADYRKYSEKRATREQAYQKKYYNMLLAKEALFVRRSERPEENEEIKLLLK